MLTIEISSRLILNNKNVFLESCSYTENTLHKILMTFSAEIIHIL